MALRSFGALLSQQRITGASALETWSRCACAENASASWDPSVYYGAEMMWRQKLSGNTPALKKLGKAVTCYFGAERLWCSIVSAMDYMCFGARHLQRVRWRWNASASGDPSVYCGAETIWRQELSTNTAALKRFGVAATCYCGAKKLWRSVVSATDYRCLGARNLQQVRWR